MKTLIETEDFARHIAGTDIGEHYVEVFQQFISNPKQDCPYDNFYEQQAVYDLMTFKGHAAFK